MFQPTSDGRERGKEVKKGVKSFWLAIILQFSSHLDV